MNTRQDVIREIREEAIHWRMLSASATIILDQPSSTLIVRRMNNLNFNCRGSDTDTRSCNNCCFLIWLLLFICYTCVTLFAMTGLTASSLIIHSTAGNNDCLDKNHLLWENYFHQQQVQERLRKRRVISARRQLLTMERGRQITSQ